MENIKVALVMFKDETQKIVPLESIENFFPKKKNDFKKNQKYKVWWFGTKSKNDNLLNGHILLLGCKYIK